MSNEKFRPYLNAQELTTIISALALNIRFLCADLWNAHLPRRYGRDKAMMRMAVLRAWIFCLM